MRLFTINHRKIIQEDDSNSTLSMFKAGLDRLTTSLNPNTPNDLDILLKFVAPHGGGIQKVQQLLQVSNTSAKTWWNTLFTTFGLTDTTQQQEIVRRTRDQAGEAIKICTDIVIQTLNDKLTELGLTPENIATDLQQWEQIQTRFKGNVKPSQVLEPNELQEYRELAQRLIKAYKLVQPDINSSPYEDIEIEAPPSDPTPEDLSQMPDNDPLSI